MEITLNTKNARDNVRAVFLHELCFGQQLHDCTFSFLLIYIYIQSCAKKNPPPPFHTNETP